MLRLPSFKPVLLAVSLLFLVVDPSSAEAYLKIDTIPGESKDDRHREWIDVLSIDWGVHKPADDGIVRHSRGHNLGGGTGSGMGGMIGRTRGDAAPVPGTGMTAQPGRRGAAVVEDVTLTMEYDKSSPKLMEKCMNGEVIPKLEIDLTARQSRETYLKYELTNVIVTSYQMSASGDDKAGRPTVVVGNNFEGMTVTYQELGGQEGEPLTTTASIEVGDRGDTSQVVHAMKPHSSLKGHT